MKCVDCSYYWKEDHEAFPCCHYPYDDDYAPCAIDDMDYVEDEED